MKFKPGDLVMLVSSLGDLLSDHPPALILSGGIGYSAAPADTNDKEPEEIYTILFSGELERKVSADWLDLVERAN
jgi:hypothetical protein